MSIELFIEQLEALAQEAGKAFSEAADAEREAAAERRR